MLSNLEMAVDYAAKHIEIAINGHPAAWLMAETWFRNAEFMMNYGAES